MKKRIIGKLRSQTGASITFALLLFLVCIVLCSVIITASTASSGRMSQIVETDQRYYAVTSAAELLKNIIDGKTVSIVKVVETTNNTVYTSGVAGTPTQDGEAVTSVYLIPDKKAGAINETADLIDGNKINSAAIKTIPMDAAKKFFNNVTLTDTDRKLELASTVYDGAGLDFDALAVTIEENLDANGRITLTIYNKYKAKETNSSEGDRYTMVLTFGADKSEVTNTKTENISSTASSSISYTLKTKTTETTITTLTWNLSGIKTHA